MTTAEMHPDPAPAPAAATPSRRSWNPVQQDAATLLVSSAESGGERSLFEIELSPGGRNMPHRHRTYAEHFEALEGTLTVEVDGRTLELAPGQTAEVPAGVVHNFSNPTGSMVRYRVELRPGHAGFERALEVVYGLARDGRTNGQGIPRNPVHLALLAEWSEVGMTGASRLLEPLFSALVRLARRRGTDRELIDRYCTW